MSIVASRVRSGRADRAPQLGRVDELGRPADAAQAALVVEQGCDDGRSRREAGARDGHDGARAPDREAGAADVVDPRQRVGDPEGHGLGGAAPGARAEHADLARAEAREIRRREVGGERRVIGDGGGALGPVHQHPRGRDEAAALDLDGDPGPPITAEGGVRRLMNGVGLTT